NHANPANVRSRQIVFLSLLTISQSDEWTPADSVSKLGLRLPTDKKNVKWPPGIIFSSSGETSYAVSRYGWLRLHRVPPRRRADRAGRRGCRSRRPVIGPVAEFEQAGVTSAGICPRSG